MFDPANSPLEVVELITRRLGRSTEEALKNIFDRLERLETTVANAISNGTVQQQQQQQYQQEKEEAEQSQQSIELQDDQPKNTPTPGAASAGSSSRGSPFSRTETLAVNRTFKRPATRSPSAAVQAEEAMQPGSPSLTQLVAEATNLARAVLSVKAPETASSPSHHEEAAVLDSLHKVETETVKVPNNAHTGNQFLMPSTAEIQAWLQCMHLALPAKSGCIGVVMLTKAVFFRQAPEYYLFSLRATIPDDFMLMIPELIDSPDTTLDKACLISCYSLAQQGLALDDSEIPNRLAYSQGLYKACLNLLEPWKNKKPPYTTLDIVAALSMVSLPYSFRLVSRI